MVKYKMSLNKLRGQNLRDFLGAQAIFDPISRLASQYRHSQLQLQYCPSWESNIRRVDHLYCSGSWAIFYSIHPALLGLYFPVHSSWTYSRKYYPVDWVNPSKRGGMDGVFRGLEGLLRGTSRGRSPREIPRSSPASPTLLLGFTFYLK